MNTNLISFISILFILLLWKSGAVALSSPLILPPPEEVVAVFYSLMTSPDFLHHWAATMWRAVIAFFLSMTAGLVVGILSGISRECRAFFQPYIIVIRAVPVLAVILLAVMWLESGRVPVFVAFLMSFPLFEQNVQQGIRETDPKLLEVARFYRWSRADVIRHIYLPSCVPFLYSAVIANAGLVWKVVIAAEILSQPLYAIGTKMQYAQMNLATAEVMAWTLLAVITSGALDRLLRLSWRRNVRS
ncbi:ABC transporter permease subunit [Vibrio sp. JC009]|uniref:ABC transporter permease n=1 Tax=Vibrio sp. JC009 TaxID=2912314 RepID=UPI0023AFA4B4|nr:ABC transporter permease subunit [Vibrio sp. JC009]WED22926.1 ABC transporter permease subunit [Vibrio sp. JC009]